MMQSINPATEELIANYDPMTTQQVEEVLAGVRQAFLGWRGWSRVMLMCNLQSGFVGQAFGMVGGYRSEWPKALGRRCPCHRSHPPNLRSCPTALHRKYHL